MFRVSAPQAIANCAITAAVTSHILASTIPGPDEDQRVELARATVVGGMAVALVTGTYAALVRPRDLDVQLARRVFAGGVGGLLGPLIGICLRNGAYGSGAYRVTVMQGILHGTRGMAAQVALVGVGVLTKVSVEMALRRV